MPLYTRLMPGVNAVLLPTTAHILRLPVLPPARAMIAAGVVVSLGSDYNPNAHCLSMPYVMHLACIMFHMTPREALVAATINAAASIGGYVYAYACILFCMTHS